MFQRGRGVAHGPAATEYRDEQGGAIQRQKGVLAPLQPCDFSPNIRQLAFKRKFWHGTPDHPLFRVLSVDSKSEYFAKVIR